MMKKLGISIVFIFIFSAPQLLAQKINWISIEDLEAVQAKESRKVVIDVYTSWCGWCKRMDATTFVDAKLVAYLNENYYCVKLDGEEKDSIKFKGKEFPFVKNGRRGYNKIAFELLSGKMSYPTLVVLDENLDILQVFKGYKSAADLLPIITFLGEDIFKDKKWEDYIKESKSEK